MVEKTFPLVKCIFVTHSLLTDKEEDLHWSQKVSQCNLFFNRTVMEHTWRVWDQML